MQIDCKITTGLVSMRETLSQPATLHLPPVAMDAVNAKVDALEAIQEQEAVRALPEAPQK